MNALRLAVIGLTLGFSLASEAAAQYQLNLPDVDRKTFTYGLQFGGHVSLLDLKRSEALQTDPDLIAAEPVATGGFSVGVIVNWQLPDEHWDLRFTPNVAFYERTVDFVYRDSVFNETFETRNLELPVMFRFKSNRRKNHRMFMTGGVIGSYELGNQREADDVNFIEISKTNFEVAYGFGIDLYLTYFRFAPEIRISHGVPNLLQEGDPTNAFANALDRITTHKIALLLNFEG